MPYAQYATSIVSTVNSITRQMVLHIFSFGLLSNCRWNRSTHIWCRTECNY